MPPLMFLGCRHPCRLPSLEDFRVLSYCSGYFSQTAQQLKSSNDRATPILISAVLPTPYHASLLVSFLGMCRVYSSTFFYSLQLDFRFRSREWQCSVRVSECLCEGKESEVVRKGWRVIVRESWGSGEEARSIEKGRAVG